jgi:hypothetical protein
MKFAKLFLVAVAGSALSMATSHATLVLNFSSTLGSSIQFNGSNSSFQFDSSTLNGPFYGSQWVIGGESGGTGSATGLLGVFINGPFGYGSIVTSGAEQSATVTPSLAAIVIQDGFGNNLTGNINWGQIETFNYAGGINAGLTINLTDLTYTGTNPDLLALAAGGSGALDLTFQFSPGETLSDLSSGSGSHQTTYSGSLTVPEQANAAFLLLISLSAMACFRRFAISRQI